MLRSWHKDFGVFLFFGKSPTETALVVGAFELFENLKLITELENSGRLINMQCTVCGFSHTPLQQLCCNFSLVQNYK